MQIRNQTAYTYDCITEFNTQHQRSLKRVMTVLWVIVGILATLTLLMSVALLILDREAAPNAGLIFMLAIGVALAVLRLFVAPSQVKRAIRAQADKNNVVTYHFTDEEFEESTESVNNSSQSRNQYAVVTKVTESRRYLYLYISPTQAHIVDKQGFTEGTEQDFRALLRTVIEAKKLHIQ